MHTNAHPSAGAVARDLSNRARGLIARFRAHEPASDEVLVARIRSKLGHICSHPRAIAVAAHDGVIHLTGMVIAAEELRVLWAVAGVDGVRNVHNDLEVHESLPDTVPRRSPWLHTKAPGVRFAIGAAALVACVAVLRRL